MTPDEKRDLDRRVAAEMYPPCDNPYIRPAYMDTCHGLMIVHNGNRVEKFAPSADPADADLVRQEIEKRGWRWWIIYREADGYSASVIIPHEWNEDKDRHYPSHSNSHHVALCLAFLAACEAQKGILAEK